MVRTLVAAIRSYEQPLPGQALGPESEAKNRAIVDRAHAALDLRGLAERSLLGTWSELPPTEREEFLTLLRRLFAEVAYPQSAKFFSELDLDFKDVGERRGQRVVEVAVSHPDEGLIDLAFFLEKVEGRWKIRDLTLDGVSLARDIQSQMQQIIRDEGYPRLVERMRTKLEEEGRSAARAPTPSTGKEAGRATAPRAGLKP